MIRVTVQIEDEEDESRATVISASFENFDEIVKTKFLEKVRPFDVEENCEPFKEEKAKKQKIGFGRDDNECQ